MNFGYLAFCGNNLLKPSWYIIGNLSSANCEKRLWGQNNATHGCRCSIELTNTEEYSRVKTDHQEGRHAAIDQFG